MNRISSKNYYLVVSWLLSMALPGLAQENDLYKNMMKEMMKETIKMDFKLNSMDMKIAPTPGYIELDVNKKPLPKLGFNHKQNSLLLQYKDSLKFEPELTISPYLTMAYSNQFDPNAMDTDGQIITNAVLVPLTAIGLLNFGALFDYLIRAGVIPYDDPVLPKETKKQKALRIITKEVYPTSDD